jgi:hypothetical protein
MISEAHCQAAMARIRDLQDQRRVYEMKITIIDAEVAELEARMDEPDAVAHR